MKKFILGIGETLLGLLVIIGILFAIIATFSSPTGLIVGITIILGIVSITFLLYLLIDIRDKSIETNKLLKELKDTMKIEIENK